MEMEIVRIDVGLVFLNKLMIRVKSHKYIKDSSINVQSDVE